MNIFLLDTNPKLAAQYQCDKHVVKMILESAQLLCSAHHELGTTNLPEKFYKKTHVNHPCSKWIREHRENYNWLAEHALYLCEEYSYRYGKIHASQNLIGWLLVNEPNIRGWYFQKNEVYPPNTFRFGDKYWLTEPPQCMPDEYKSDCPVVAYRNYYNKNKRHEISCKWTKRQIPEWWTNDEIIIEDV